MLGAFLVVGVGGAIYCALNLDPGEASPADGDAPTLTTADLATVTQLARQPRVDSMRASTSAGSGHPTSSMSAADRLAVLVARHLRYIDLQAKQSDHDRGEPPAKQR